MYGIAQAVVATLGCTPGLGFIHSGHELFFVLDVADLYKTEIGIPIAFDTAAAGAEDVGSHTRRPLRDKVNDISLLDRCVSDIKQLLLPRAVVDDAIGDLEDRVTHQFAHGQDLASGRNYAGEVIW